MKLRGDPLRHLFLVIAVLHAFSIPWWFEDGKPSVLLGLRRRLSARTALAGVVCGTLLAAGLTLAGYTKVAGIHAGLLDALLNAAVAVLGSPSARRAEP